MIGTSFWKLTSHIYSYAFIYVDTSYTHVGVCDSVIHLCLNSRGVKPATEGKHSILEANLAFCSTKTSNKAAGFYDGEPIKAKCLLSVK